MTDKLLAVSILPFSQFPSVSHPFVK